MESNHYPVQRGDTVTQTLEHSAADALERGRQAHQRHDWGTALDAFRTAEKEQPLEPEDLALLGDAAWWTGDLPSAIEVRERAYAAWVRSGDKLNAARLALALVQDYAWRMQGNQAEAFLARAERLLQDEPEGPVHGFMAVMRSMMEMGGGDLENSVLHAREGSRIAREQNDPDGAALALMVEGRVLVDQGHVAEGMRLLEEAASAGVTGELGPLATGIAYCVTISACADLGDFKRAGEWTERAQQWCEKNSLGNGFPGICRVHEAEVIAFRGDWHRAEESARLATVELANFSVDTVGAAYLEIGQVRLRVGDFEGAEQAFALADEHARDPQPGLSLLRLAQGKTDQALTMIRRAVADTAVPALHRAKLLPAAVKIGITAGDLELARNAVNDLEQAAATFSSPSPIMAAHASCCRGVLMIAEGDLENATIKLREGLRAWQQAQAPYEAAVTRMYLAQAYEKQDDVEAAAAEATKAQAAFEQLGARPSVEEAAAFLRGLQQRNGGPVPTQSLLRAFMFTDIEQSTALVQALGDDAWTSLIRWHDQALRAVFGAHRGEEVDHAGDGFFVAFEDVDDALRAAVDVQRRLAAHRSEHGFAPPVRVGVHAAEAVSDGDGYKGKGVHLAARIAAQAQGGEVLVSQDTLAVAATPYPTADPRSVSLQGFEDAVEVAAIDWMLLVD